jgi:hypothetical protein
MRPKPPEHYPKTIQPKPPAKSFRVPLKPDSPTLQRQLNRATSDRALVDRYEAHSGMKDDIIIIVIFDEVIVAIALPLVAI